MLSNQPKQISGQLWPALGLATVILLSTAIGLYAVAFQLRLAGAPEFFQKFDASPVLAGMHVIGGAIVLLVGGLQTLATPFRALRSQWARRPWS